MMASRLRRDLVDERLYQRLLGWHGAFGDGVADALAELSEDGLAWRVRGDPFDGSG
jgi:hypothetical protein